jgi:hypothetical protein
LKYSALYKINFFIATYGRLFSGVFKISSWSPFLVLAIFQALGLLAFSNFYIGGLKEVLYPVLSLFLPDSIFHYPQYYLALPSVYSGYNTIILGPTIWVLMSAAAVYKLGRFRREKKAALSEGLREALKLYLPLFVFWLIEIVIIFIVLFSLTVAFKENVAGSPRIRFVFEYGYQLFAYIFSAFLIYTIPGIIISSKNLGRALKDSVILCSRNFFLTFFIIAIPGSVGAVIDVFISGFTPQIISLFNPELVVIILYVRIALGIFINLFIYGAAVFIHGEMGETGDVRP